MSIRGPDFLVGPGGIEPPTSPLSGVRSSHLSYGPIPGYHWWSWSGSNRRPPECKSGALPAELQPLGQKPFRLLPLNQSRPVGCRDSGIQSLATSKLFAESPSGDARRTPQALRRGPECLDRNGCSLLAHAVHSSAFAFKDSTHVLS